MTTQTRHVFYITAAPVCMSMKRRYKPSSNGGLPQVHPKCISIVITEADSRSISRARVELYANAHGCNHTY